MRETEGASLFARASLSVESAPLSVDFRVVDGQKRARALPPTTPLRTGARAKARANAHQHDAGAGAALPPALLELFEHCVRHGLYGDADRESLLAMYRLDPGATCDLVGEMAARVLRCRRCRHFRRPGLADSGCCGERADLPVVYGLLHALPPDHGAWCPRFASAEARP